MAMTTPTCENCSELQKQLSSMQAAAAQSDEASEVGDRTMRLELDAADKRRATSKAQAHVASVTMQNELESAEQQLSLATALTHQTLLEAREAAREADVRQAAVASELPLAESGRVLAPQLDAEHLRACFARLSGAIEEVQPHLQEQVRAQHPPHHRVVTDALDRLRLRLGLWLRHVRCLHSACPGISGALRGSAIVLQGGDTIRLRQVAHSDERRRRCDTGSGSTCYTWVSVGRFPVMQQF